MLQLRPTFSESWYRVVNLRARLRPGAQISRQFYRGERWYVVRDPAGNQFHRLSDAAYRFVGLLDGTRTVGEAWDLVGGQLADDAPTQPEVIQILSQLHAANLVESDVPPDAMVLLRRHKLHVKRKMQGRLMNLLFPRIPLWDPDRFLQRWMPVVRPLLSKWGAVLWCAVIIAALAALGPHWQDIKRATSSSIAPGNWLWLWAVFVVIKFIHECGHAFACRRFGGEVHEMGIMFLVFIPTPYVDASTAWAFPSRWARMFVGAAGMIVELFVAALLAFFWIATKDSGMLVTQLAFNAMLIASVSTVIFNANPLLRYDGYYMLSDFLEIPNLQHRSQEYLLGLIKRHVFRIKQTQPLPPLRQRIELAIYGVASSIYRAWVGIMIILLVAWKLPVIGILMALGGVITWLVAPVVKVTKYLAIEPELHRKRGRATAFVVGMAAVVFFAFGLVRFPLHVYADGIVRPLKQEVLHAAVPGFVVKVEAKDGQWIEQGQTILVCEDPELTTKLRLAELRLKAAVIQRDHASAVDPNQKQIAESEVKTIESEVSDLRRQQLDLTVKAPIAGQLIAPMIHHYPGRYFERGAEIATVATVDQLQVRASVPQSDAQLAPREGAETEIRLVGDPGRVLHGEGTHVIPGAQIEVPDPALTHIGGGDIEADPQDRSGRRARIPQYELRTNLSNAEGLYFPGQRAFVRCTVDRKPLIWQIYRRFMQLVEKSNNSKWT